MRALLFIASLLLALFSHGQIPEIAWGTLFSGHGHVRLGDVVLAEGVDGCVINGFFSEDLFLPQDTLTRIDGTDDHFLARLNYLGTIMWSVQVSGELRSVRLVGDGQVVAIATYTDSCVVQDAVLHSSGSGISFVVIRVSADGTVIDVENHQDVIEPFDNDFNTITVVTDVDPHGVHITGSFNDSLRLADTLLVGGQSSVYIAKFTDDFELLWTERLGRASPPHVLPVDSAGSIYYTIEYPVWTTEDTLLGNSAAGLLCLNMDGDEHWRYETMDPPWSPTVTVLSPDRVYFQSEYAEGSPVVWRTVRRLNADGELMQQDVYSTEGGAWLDPTSHPDGGVLMSGWFYGNVSYTDCSQFRGLPTHVIMKWDDEGVCEWSRTIVGGNVWGGSAKVNEAGTVFTSGTFEFSVQLGPDTLYWATPGRFSGYVTALTSLPLGDPQQPGFQEILISPNPTNSSIRILRSTGSLETWRITDAMGKELAHGSYSSPSLDLDLSTHAPGVYFFSSGSSFARIIKD